MAFRSACCDRMPTPAGNTSPRWCRWLSEMVFSPVRRVAGEPDGRVQPRYDHGRFLRRFAVSGAIPDDAGGTVVVELAGGEGGHVREVEPGRLRAEVLGEPADARPVERHHPGRRVHGLDPV